MSTVKYVFFSLAILVALQATTAAGCACKRTLYMTESPKVYDLTLNSEKNGFDPITISLDDVIPPDAYEVTVYVLVSLVIAMLKYLVYHLHVGRDWMEL